MKGLYLAIGVEIKGYIPPALWKMKKMFLMMKKLGRWKLCQKILLLIYP
jgi:hypothetical protein